MVDLPMLSAEARIASRRCSTYAARAAYGLLLLGLLGVFHQSHEDWSAGRPVANNELVRFASEAFEWLGVGQALIVMVLVPAIVAGSIAEERSRGTLEGLLVSRFSGMRSFWTSSRRSCSSSACSWPPDCRSSVCLGF